MACIHFHDFSRDLSPVVLLKLIICFFISGVPLFYINVNNYYGKVIFLNNCWFEMS